MGGGASKKSPTTVTSSWTKEEQEANDKSVALQHIASDFIIEHIYYKIPIKCGKKSVDPASPIYIQIDPEIVEEGMDEALQKSVPSGVTVSGEGLITCEFVFTNISYVFHVSDIKKSMSEYSEEGDLIIPRPGAPWGLHETSDSIQLRWVLPQPTGIVREIDLQYTTDLSVLQDRESYKLKPNNSSSPPVSPDKNVLIRGNAWHSLVNKTWDSSTFQFHVMENLQPGSKYIARIRYRNYKGWSPFSKPSIVLKTLPGPPARPDPPGIDVLLSDSIQLKWNYGLDNGAIIEEYIVRGRSGGEEEFTEMSSGSPDRVYLAMHLLPENVYSFQIAARNSQGISQFSEMCTVTTPRIVKIKTEIDARHLAGYNCKDAWRELYDPKTEQNFYFNQLTGTRQLAMPDILKDVDVSVSDDQKHKKCHPEVGFRKKRFRLLKGMHQQKHNHTKHKGSSNSSNGNRCVTPPPGVKIRGTPPAHGHTHSPCITGIDRESSPPPTSHVPHSRARTPEPISTSIHTSTPASNENLESTVENSNLFETNTNDDINYRKDIFTLELHREKMLYDCYSKFKSVSHAEMFKRLKTTFVGERGIDSGGISKEMFLLISKEILNYCGKKGKNWITTLSDGTIHFKNPNEQSNVKEKSDNFEDQEGKKEKDDVSDVTISDSYVALEKAKITPTMFAKFMGKFVGKAVFDRQLIDIPLSKQLRLSMLGMESEIRSGSDGTDGDENKQDISNQNHNKDKVALMHLEKLKDIDVETYNSLKWMLTNSITDILFESFTVTINGIETPLCKNGDQKEVTNENKHEYIRLIVDWKTKYSIATLLEPFLEGFHEIVPLNVLQSCELTIEELDLILNGKPTIDIDEIRGYCMFQGARVYGLEEDECKFGEDSEVVQWLWMILRSFEDAQCRSYLHFVTGTSRVPLDGYDPPFNITDGMDMDPDSLPKAHTCFNQIVLPRYTTYEKMKEKITYAIQNTTGFQLS